MHVASGNEGSTVMLQVEMRSQYSHVASGNEGSQCMLQVEMKAVQSCCKWQ